MNQLLLGLDCVPVIGAMVTLIFCWMRRTVRENRLGEGPFASDR